MNNICYNERQGIWTTKYDWSPIVSENINGTFFSIGGSNATDEINNKIWSHSVNKEHKNIDNKKGDLKANPTQWYGEQHPFEFEFVVSEPQGVHKIIENLQIMSNNVQPEQLTFEIIGDVYQFNKERISHLGRGEGTFMENRISSDLTNKNEFNIPEKTASEKSKTDKLNGLIKNMSKTKIFLGTDWVDMDNVFTKIEKNKRTKQFHIIIPQECRNIETFGRRLGNIQYREDSWYTTVEPIVYDARLDDPNVEEYTDISNPKLKSTKIRDKWCKIRVRYSGEDLAIISAIRTIMNV